MWKLGNVGMRECRNEVLFIIHANKTTNISVAIAVCPSVPLFFLEFQLRVHFFLLHLLRLIFFSVVLSILVGTKRIIHLFFGSILCSFTSYHARISGNVI